MKPRRLRALALALFPLAAGLPAALGAQDLAIGPGDVRIEARDDGGYDLYLRKKPGIASVLLTESTKDPAMKADNFAYRAAEYNDVNGREKRMLNGKALPPSSKLYSLISSTPLPDKAFGQAFRILIPPVLVYGYSWSRSGTVAVGKGTFINIRAFARPYADYAGAFMDNPYEIKISTKSVPPPSPPPAPQPAAQPTQEQPKPVIIAPQEPPKKEPPPPPKDDRTSSKIGEAIESAPGKTLDLVVCLDTTQSMDPYIEDVKKNLGPIIRTRVSGFKSFRVGLVLYKDYWPDDYITRKYPFTDDISAFERSLRGITVMGGKDIPEAENEALYSAATEFEWSADRRQIILVTDAPPHPEPRGKILFEDAVREAESRQIEMDSITEPKAITPPRPAIGELEHTMKRLASLASGGAKVRLLEVVDEKGESDGRTIVTSSARAPDRAAALESAVDSALAAAPNPDIVRPAKTVADLGPRSGPLPAAVLEAAAAAGASHVLASRTRSCGALSETVSRLVDAATGAELARDIVWRAGNDGSEAVFINGTRVK